MKISLNWIKEFVDIPSSYSPKRLAELLTLRTCEVEGFEDRALSFSNMVVGKILKIRLHPNADKLRIADTDIGERTVQIVCGGENLEEGMFTAVALPGSLVKWHGEGDLVELKETKIRGETSVGMICAEEEIGLPPLTPRKGITITNLAYHLSGGAAGKQPKPGTPLAKALKLDDVIFEIDNKSITHRPDLWGHYGMAREFAAFLDGLGAGKAGHLRPFVAHNPNPPKKGPSVKIEIKKTEIASRFLSVIISGVHVEPSPQWMQDRLRALGVRPVNNIVDVTNYVMHELGQPMHAFDRSVVGNDHFVIRFAKPGEKTQTLDHKTRELHTEDALVTNGDTVLGIAGVMGGKNSEITPKTTEIILEAACWNPVLIRKTAQRHGLRSDAAQRFEKSLDPEITGIAFHRACELILKICPNAAFSGPATDLYPSKNKVRKLAAILLNPADVSRKIGVPIKAAEIEKHLKALEFGVKKAAKDKLRVEIPTFRATKDINIEDDLVEEVARMHGYENIPAMLPLLPIRLPRENRERNLKHIARRILSLGLGFCELNHYSFYGRPEIRNALLPEILHVEIGNPLTLDQTHLRVSLIPNILKSVATNLYQRESFKLYEIGRTYIKTSDYFPQEEKFICGVTVGQNSGQSGKKKTEIFYSALGALQNFLTRFGADGANFEDKGTPPPYAHPSKCGFVKMNGQEVAAVYELHPQVLKNFGIEANVAVFEINFTKLAAQFKPKANYTPLPKFPGIEIDVSVLVPKQTQARCIARLMKNTDQSLISRITLIDIFEDIMLGADKKSLTFRVLLQSPDRTLTDDEMQKVQERIFKTLRDEGFSIR